MAASPWPLIHAEREALARELTGRTVAVDDLSGNGLATLRSRLQGR